MLSKFILMYGRRLTLVCDGQCNKAWGINNRPRKQLSDDEDDYCWIPDHELAEAPTNPGTYEGGHGKPSGVPLTSQDSIVMNKWCSRECERSEAFESHEVPVVRDFVHPVPNKPSSRRATQPK